MSSQKIANSFLGLDTDTSTNKYPKDRYVECKNFRTLLNEENGTHSLINIKGNSLIATFKDTIIGIGEFLETIVIFTNSDSVTKVLDIPKSILLTASSTDILNEDNYVILTNESWGYTENTRLKLICKEETSELKKVYFIDGVSNMKFINIADSNLQSVDINKFEIIPTFKVSPIQLDISSGSLKAGKVGYAYQLYNTYGTESRITPISRLLDIYNSPDGIIRKIRGSDIGTVTTKGINVTIDNLDNTFDRIRLIRVHYETISSEPSISIISESSYINSFSFLDTGIPGLDTLTIEEFNFLGLSPIAATFEEKNNYLFLGNTKDNVFEVDWTNTSVDIQDDIKEILLAYNSTEIEASSIDASYANLDNSSKYVGYQNAERYRFGVIGYNENLIPSFVHPIPDYIFRDQRHQFVKNTSNGEILARVLYPKFRISGIPDNVKYIQIVRAERNAEKRSVVDTGVIGFLIRNSDANIDMNFNASCTVSTFPISDQSIVEYTSPEILYNKNYRADGTHLEILGNAEKADTRMRGSGLSGTSSTVAFVIDTGFSQNLLNPTPIRITDQVFHTNTQDKNALTVIAGKTVKSEANRFRVTTPSGTTSIDRIGVKGSCMLLKTETALPLTFNNDTNAVLARRRKNIDANGNPINFYGDVNSTSYIPCSDILPVTEQLRTGQWIEVFGGDTFISMFENLRTTWTEDAATSTKISVTHIFPVESTINTTLTVNPTIGNLATSYTQNLLDAPYRIMQETAGVYVFTGAGNISYTQNFNLYTYNSVYSRANNIRKFFSRPTDIKFENNVPVRVYYTDKKNNGEFTDSWTKIRPNNFIDLDIRYGELVRLYNFKDTLFALQTRGVSVIPVEQRELIQTTAPGPLVAGLGDAVSNPHYLSTESGLKDYDAIASSKNALYYYDRENNKICRVEDSVKFISDELAISSLLHRKNNQIKQYPTALYDRQHNEILFNIHDDCIVLAEYKNLFTGNYEYNFDRSFTVDGKLFISIGNDVERIGNNDYGIFGRIGTTPQILNSGGRAQPSAGYANLYKDSSITLLLNPAANQSVIYDVLEITTNIYKNDELLANLHPYSIKCWNEYQDTGEILLENNPNFTQRFRTWRLNTLIDNTINEARLRSSHLFVKITFKNMGDRKYILHDLITSVRPTKVR